MKKLIAFLFLTIAFVSNAQRTMFGGNNNYVVPPPPFIETPPVTIGGQIWMSQNLDVTTYRNGDIIPQVTDEATWNSLTTGAWCYYNNDPANRTKYGKLYNWHAVNDPRGLAPAGWHIPTYDEWGILITHLNSTPGDIDKKLKAVGSDWSNNSGATNQSGFTGFPGGARAGGFFSRLGNHAFWWTSVTCAYAWMQDVNNTLRRDVSIPGFGLSVRCVKD